MLPIISCDKEVGKFYSFTRRWVQRESDFAYQIVLKNGPNSHVFLYLKMDQIVPLNNLHGVNYNYTLICLGPT